MRLDLDRRHCAAKTDPQDRVAAHAALARQARIEGAGVWWAPLASLEAWRQASEATQDVVANEVARCLGGGWRLLGMRVWECACYLLGSPAREEDTVEAIPIRHRLALLEHVATGAEFSLVPGGEAEHHPMCSTDPTPLDEPCLACGDRRIRPLLVARWPVTFGQFHRGLGDNPTGSEINLPATGVEHETGVLWSEYNGLRLPTAAEWTHAAHGGAPTRFPWGDEVDLAYVWYAGSHHPRPHPPSEHDRQGKHNAFGLVDTFGNVMEWCQDEAHDDHVSGCHVAMGGSYACSARSIEANAHTGHAAAGSSPRVGFRPVCDIPKWRAP